MPNHGSSASISADNHLHSVSGLGLLPGVGGDAADDAPEKEFRKVSRPILMWILCSLASYMHDQTQLRVLDLYSTGDMNHDALMQIDEFRRLLNTLSASSPDMKAVNGKALWGEMRARCPFLKDDLVPLIDVCFRCMSF